MEKLSLSTEIFERLKNRIIRWEYLPGQRLTEESLCAEFGVSRIPVREALRMLEDSKLVDKVLHRGCTVKQPDLVELNELYDVRLALELFVVEQLALKGMEPAAWRRLHHPWSSLSQQDNPAELDPFQLARLDESFHEGLAEASGNRSLFELLRSINERLYFTRVTDITTLERLTTTCRQHLQVLEQIQARNVTAARDAIQINVEFGRRNVKSALKEALARAYLGQKGEDVFDSSSL